MKDLRHQIGQRAANSSDPAILSFYHQLLHDGTSYGSVLSYRSIFSMIKTFVMTYVITLQFSDVVDK